MVNLEDLKHEAVRILKSGKVKFVIGYQEGTDQYKAMPAFLKDPEDAEKLVWDPSCVHNLAKFLVDDSRRKKREREPDTRPVGIVVKGCDSRAINVLIQEKFIDREDVHILGVSCENSGVVDEKKLAKALKGKRANKVDYGEDGQFVVTTDDGSVNIPAEDVLAERCLECKANFPVVYDVILGDKAKKSIGDPFESVQKMEDMSTKERWEFWNEQFGRCIRCYACRSACPMCYCDECVVDTINFVVEPDTTAEEKAQKIKWIEKSPTESENSVYHLVRAMHLAGRCIDCGECERVCPLDIPIRFLNKKLEKEAKKLFNYDVGFDPDIPALVSSFKDEDPEEFIR
jgi:coenzyme F420-reducing hydrogenase beta subunit